MDRILVIFDSGCTYTVALFESDFIEEIKPLNKLMNGLGSTAKNVGVNMVGWSFRYYFSIMSKVNVKAYYVPVSKVRSLSPQKYFEQEKGGTFAMIVEGNNFTFSHGGALSFNYASSPLPILYASIVQAPSTAGYLSSTGRPNISKD